MPARLREDDHEPADEQVPLVYKELNGLAGAYAERERSDHILQVTQLENLSFTGEGSGHRKMRVHFFAIARCSWMVSSRQPPRGSPYAGQTQ